MASKRIMLLGANGQVSQALRAEALPADWQLSAYGHAECDITDHRAVQTAIQNLKPDLVINTAAMTAVDKCETEKDQAIAANFDGPANLAAQCSVLDIPLIHLSTDYVFDGKDGNKPYRVDDQMHPINIYGETKMLGEEAIIQGHAFHVILRISSVFSAYGTNLLTKMLQAIDTRDELKIVTDQICAPTPAQDVARALITITEALLKGKSGGYGVFQLCGTPEVNRMKFSQAVMDAYAPYTTCRPIILPALSSDFPGFAARPAYSVMDCSKILEVYGIEQRPWRDGLHEAMQILMQGKRQVA
jgi:dTDP-4-dehydrorhamnose reductase